VTEMIFGRLAVRMLVRDHLARPEPNAGERRRPVLVVEGRPGSGRTSVVDALAGELSGRSPYARFDLAEAQRRIERTDGVAPLIALAARHLHQACKPYGRLNFPRLTIAFAVMTLDLTGTDPREPRRALNRALRTMRGSLTVTKWLQDAAHGLTDQFPLPVTPPASFVNSVID
jgi:hypothetical protein